MKTNKKNTAIIMGCLVAVSGMFFLAKPARAGNVISILVSPFIDPITNLIVTDRFSCSVNLIWGCDSAGNSLPATSACPATSGRFDEPDWIEKASNPSPNPESIFTLCNVGTAVGLVDNWLTGDATWRCSVGSESVDCSAAHNVNGVCNGSINYASISQTSTDLCSRGIQASLSFYETPVEDSSSGIPVSGWKWRCQGIGSDAEPVNCRLATPAITPPPVIPPSCTPNYSYKCITSGGCSGQPCGSTQTETGVCTGIDSSSCGGPVLYDASKVACGGTAVCPDSTPVVCPACSNTNAGDWKEVAP